MELLITDNMIYEQLHYGYNVEQISRIFGYQKELIELRLKNLSLI